MTRDGTSQLVGSQAQSSASLLAITIGTCSGVSSGGGSNETSIGASRDPSESEITADEPSGSTPSGRFAGSGPSCTSSVPPVAAPAGSTTSTSPTRTSVAAVASTSVEPSS